MTQENNSIDLTHLYKEAYNAFTNTSFSPDRRARQTVDQYAAELSEDLAAIRRAAGPEITAEVVTAAQDRYKGKYLDQLRGWLISSSRVASSAVVGPSNFPVERNRKYTNWANNKYEQFRQWRERALKAIRKGLATKIDPLEDVRQRLTGQLRTHRLMKAANKIIRKGGHDVCEQLIGLGFTQEAVQEIVSTKRFGGPGFARFSLTNSNAEIHRLRERLAQLEFKKEKADTVGTERETIQGIEIVRNYPEDRVQIIFPDALRPSKEKCKALRKNGFVFSYRNRAWQRKLNTLSYNIAKEFVKNL